ncbi:MAG: alpha/beta hydrolase, partial [Planctomycetota bacterium]
KPAAERRAAPLAPSHRNVRYLEQGNPRLNALDIYAPEEAEGLPVVVYVHGGGWSKGDKARVGGKAKLFTGEGYVFVSVNYRLSPKVQHPVHVQDVAAALAWVHGNISRYGGDPKRIGIIGHSAGAHLVALVATDESRLGAHGLDLSVIKGVVPIDIGVYDMAQLGRRDSSGRWSSVFGTDPAGLKDASPLFHVAAGKAIPDFLILVAGSREKQPGKVQQTRAMVSALTAAGVTAKVVAAPRKNHGQINQQIGLVDDAVTRATARFFAKQLAAPAKEDELR